jgi:hypothetical protein
MMKKTMKKVAMIMAVAALIMSAAALTTTVLVRVNYNLEIVSQLLVIAFIGGLATFVVVSNYTQVAAIEKKYEANLQKIEQSLENKYDDSTTNIGKVMKKNDEIMLELKEWKKTISKFLFKEAVKLLYRKMKEEERRLHFIGKGHDGKIVDKDIDSVFLHDNNYLSLRFTFDEDGKEYTVDYPYFYFVEMWIDDYVITQEYIGDLPNAVAECGNE